MLQWVARIVSAKPFRVGHKCLLMVADFSVGNERELGVGGSAGYRKKTIIWILKIIGKKQ